MKHSELQKREMAMNVKLTAHRNGNKEWTTVELPSTRKQTTYTVKAAVDGIIYTARSCGDSWGYNPLIGTFSVECRFLSGWCGFGAYAEYVVARESALALKPANLSFKEAASFCEIRPEVRSDSGPQTRPCRKDLSVRV